MDSKTTDIIARIKEACSLEDALKKEGYHLRGGHGRMRTCVEHDSLQVYSDGYYWWWSQGEHGDVIEWTMRRTGCDFKAAVETLCRQAGLPEPIWTGQDIQARVAARKREDVLSAAARVFAGWLAKDQGAMDYAHGRGWTDETIRAAMLGYSGTGSADERAEMLRELSMAGCDVRSPAAIAIVGMKGGVAAWLKENDMDPGEHPDWVEKGYIPGMMGRGRLVYPHLQGGRVVYLGGRRIAEKEHFNLAKDLVGAKQFYFNHAYRSNADYVVIVEGQADAISLGQMEIPAAAILNVQVRGEEGLLDWTRKHKAVYLSLDFDRAGMASTYQLANLIGPMTRLLRLNTVKKYNTLIGGDGQATPVKDANDQLKAFVQGGVETKDQNALIYAAMQAAPTFVEERCQVAGEAQGAERDEAVKGALEIIAKMDELSLSTYRGKLAKALGVNLRELDHMLKTMSASQKAESAGEPIYTWGGYLPSGWLLEYLYDIEAHTSQLAWRDPEGRISAGENVVIDGQKYVPAPPNETLKNNGVGFPSKLGEDKPIAELLGYVEMFIKRHYLLPNDQTARLMAYWVMLTWIYDCFNSIIYLRATGEAGAGKSELMRRIGLISYRTMSANGAGSTSSLFRALERYRGTVFIDEADINNSDTEADMIKFYNLGAMRGNPIWRTVEVTGPNGMKDFEERAFQTFSPKLIAMRKEFRDDAVGSRSLTFKIQPRSVVELKAAGVSLEINQEMRSQATALRNLLLRWRLKTWQPEIEINPDFYDLTISARLNQVAGPLLAIAADDPEQQEEIRRNLRDYYKQTLIELSMTITARTIEAMWKIWKYPDLHHGMVRAEKDGTFWIKVGDVTTIANQIIDEMNDTHGGGEEEEGAGGGKKRSQKELTSQGIGRVLRGQMQLQMSPRRRDGFWVEMNEPRLLGLSIRYGVDPEEIGPENPHTQASEDSGPNAGNHPHPIPLPMRERGIEEEA